MTYVLTGASGWIGRNALACYEQMYGRERLLADVVPLASEPKTIDFGSPHGPVEAKDLRAITSIGPLSGIFHCAFLKRRRISEFGVGTFIDQNQSITDLVVQALKNNHSASTVHISSGAASRHDRIQGDVILDPYGVLKKREELRFEKLSESRLCLSLRVYALSGPLFAASDSYALLSFARSALMYGYVEVKTHQKVLRSYVHAQDLVSLAWRFLSSSGLSGYYRIDACNVSTDLHALAEAVSLMTNTSLREAEINASAPVDDYQGDSSEFIQLAYRLGIDLKGLAEQIRSTLVSVQAC
jgi:nucleoside-diphosphate-sugar epimerase